MSVQDPAYRPRCYFTMMCEMHHKGPALPWAGTRVAHSPPANRHSNQVSVIRGLRFRETEFSGRRKMGETAPRASGTPFSAHRSDAQIPAISGVLTQLSGNLRE